LRSGGREVRKAEAFQTGFYKKTRSPAAGTAMRGPGPLSKRFEVTIYQFVELISSFLVPVSLIIPHWSSLGIARTRHGEEPKYSLISLSIPGIVTFPVLLPPGHPVFADEVEVFRKVRMEPEQWRKTWAGGPLPAFPTPGISSLLCTGPDDTSLFAPALPAREAAFQPDYRLQDL
jgi:hypothetical protein